MAPHVHPGLSMTPSQLWNRVKAFVEQTIPDHGRVVKDDVAAKIYREMKFLATDTQAKPGAEHGT